MSSVVDHNKLIKQAATLVLKPNGLFQKGSSRIWIDDNGWYLIVVEFQPSAWSKGSYLNVGIHYLWREQEYLSFDYGHRAVELVSFEENPELFLQKMHMLAGAAMQKVCEYRRFGDLQYARNMILANDRFVNKVHNLYHKMMICGMIGDPYAVYCFRELEGILLLSETEWEKAYYRELCEKIAPIVQDTDLLRAYVLEKIRHQREFWGSKSGMKKLKKQETP